MLKLLYHLNQFLGSLAEERRTQTRWFFRHQFSTSAKPFLSLAQGVLLVENALKGDGEFNDFEVFNCILHLLRVCVIPTLGVYTLIIY